MSEGIFLVTYEMHIKSSSRKEKRGQVIREVNNVLSTVNKMIVRIEIEFFEWGEKRFE